MDQIWPDYQMRCDAKKETIQKHNKSLKNKHVSTFLVPFKKKTRTKVEVGENGM